MAHVSNIEANNTSYGIRATAIPYGVVDSTSTSTAYTATVPGISELTDGVCCLIKNGKVTSESGFTLNVNGLGAKPSYSNMATGNPVTPTTPTRDTTIFNINYTMLFIYSESIVSGGGWICYRGYDANTNTIGYQVRSNSHSLPASQKFYRYRLLFTSADGTHYVPANTSSSTNATASRTVNQTPIDPFGHIVYYGTTAAVEANARPAASSLWVIYTLSLGYSFNKTGAALTLDDWAPVYLKCAPQANGSAIIDESTPYVQALPTTADGKIYIFLGVAYSATSIELLNNHPVYYHDGTGIRQWTGKVIPSKTSELTNDSGFITSLSGYATESYVTTAVSNLVDSAPQTLDTLNELAAALGDDPNFATTIATQIGNKQDKPLVVHFTAIRDQQTDEFQGVYTFDKTFNEIYTALNAGKEVVAYEDLEGQYLYLQNYDNNIVNFYSLLTHGRETTRITIHSDSQYASYLFYESAQMSDLPTVPSAATATPLMDGTAAVGSSSKYAKEDHVHPSDTSRVPTSRTINNKPLSSDITLTASDVGALPSNTNIPSVVNNLTTTTAGSALDATQGKALKDLVDGKISTQKFIINLTLDANNEPVFSDASNNTISTSSLWSYLSDESLDALLVYDNCWYRVDKGNNSSKYWCFKSIDYSSGSVKWITLQRAGTGEVNFSTKTQSFLTSHQTLKTINNQSLLGSGNLSLTASDVGALPNTTTIPTVPTTVSSFTNDAGYLTSHQDISGKADVVTIVTNSSTGSVTQALDPNKFYDFTGSPTSLTLTLNSGNDLCIYAGKFTAGTGFSNLTFPSTVKVADGAPSVEAGGVYEFSVMNNLLLLAKEGA